MDSSGNNYRRIKKNLSEKLYFFCIKENKKERKKT